MIEALFLTLLVFTQNPPASPPASASPDTLSEVPVEETESQPAKGAHDLGTEEIRGEEKVKIEELKPQFFPLIDPYEPINSVLKAEKYVFDQKIFEVIDSLTVPTHYLHSSYLRTPSTARLIQGDVLVFLPRFERNVASWELVISNSLGETIRRERRKGNPPSLISWDGRNDKGEIINTGEVYDFTFYAYDAVGNQTRIPGRPQKILGLLYQDGDEWVVAIAGDEIFEARTTRLTERAGQWLDEAANIVKEKFKREVVVYVYSEREELSYEECQVVAAQLLQRLVLPKDALKTAPRFFPGLQPKFSKIEIHIR